jgi:tetratricopeptide (TPR) repeat protein
MVPAPAKAAQVAVAEIVPKMNDLFRELTTEELRSYVTELRAVQKHADLAALPKVFSAIGQALFLLGDINGAFDAMKNAARYDDGVAVYWNNIACCHIARGEARQALECIKKARSRKFEAPDDEVVVACTYAEVLYRTGDVAEGRTAFRELIKKCSRGRASDWFHAADCASALGWDDDAIELLARAIAVGRSEDLGERSAADYVRDHPDLVRAVSFRSKTLGDTLARSIVSRDDAGGVPELSARVELTPEERTAIDALLEDLPTASDGLRRIFDGSSGV